MNPACLLVAALGLTLCQPLATDRLLEREKARLQGTSQVITCVDSRRELSRDVLQHVRHTYAGDRVTNTKAFAVNGVPQGPGGSVVSEFALDTSRRPYAIDVTAIRVNGNDLPPERRSTIRAIYAVGKDLMLVCGSSEASDRPASFEAAPGVVLMVLRRVK
jgi:uncharacterized protein (TIGR03067 family)